MIIIYNTMIIIINTQIIRPRKKQADIISKDATIMYRN